MGLKVNYPNRDEPISEWRLACICGHAKMHHEGYTKVMRCDSCMCPEFEEDVDAIYKDGWYIGKSRPPKTTAEKIQDDILANAETNPVWTTDKKKGIFDWFKKVKFR